MINPATGFELRYISSAGQGLCGGIGIALFYDQINILAEDVTFCNLHL